MKHLHTPKGPIGKPKKPLLPHLKNLKPTIKTSHKDCDIVTSYDHDECIGSHYSKDDDCIGSHYTKHDECNGTHYEYDSDKHNQSNKSSMKKGEKSTTYWKEEKQTSNVEKSPDKEADKKEFNYVIYSNGENIQDIPDLGYVAFNSHKTLDYGMAYDTNSHQLIFNQVGEYNIDYLAVTPEIAYFALNFNNKTLSPNSYIKGSTGLYQQDSGNVKVKVTSVPSYLRLQNISGKSASLAPEKINASLIIKKID